MKPLPSGKKSWCNAGYNSWMLITVFFIILFFASGRLGVHRELQVICKRGNTFSGAGLLLCSLALATTRIRVVWAVCVAAMALFLGSLPLLS